MVSFIVNVQKRKFIEIESRLVVAGGKEERGDWGVTAHRYTVSFWGDKMFQNWIITMTRQPYKYIKNLKHSRIGHFKRVNVTVCGLHLNESD